MIPRLQAGFRVRPSDDPFATYYGSGFLRFSNFDVKCQFRADQELDGSLQVVCSEISPQEFMLCLHTFESNEQFQLLGQTVDGQHLKAQHGRSRPLSAEVQGTFSLYFQPKKFYVTTPSLRSSRATFTITNFLFSPFTHLGEAPFQPPAHVFQLTLETGVVNVQIVPLPAYTEAAVSLQQKKHVVPTAHLVISPLMEVKGEWHFDFATKLCRLLSIASGTTIQWIAAEASNAVSDNAFRVHAATVTKPLCYLASIPIREGGYETNTRTLDAFLKSSWEKSSSLTAERFNALVSVYLDARMEGDFLETRGMKLVVCLEMLKNLFAETALDDLRQILPDKLKITIKKLIKASLKKAAIGETARELVLQNYEQLSRPSFARSIRLMVEHLELGKNNSLVQLVVRIRNSLVHNGTFLQKTVNCSDEVENAVRGDQAAQFFVLMSFVDQIVLRIFGYSGPYLDYSESTNDALRTSIRGFRTVDHNEWVIQAKQSGEA